MSSISKFTAGLRRLPIFAALRIAREAAPVLTSYARETYNQSQTPYGVPWDPSVDGHRVTLKKSEKLFSTVYYVAIGTKLRVKLGVPYAKYQIGKRAVFPTQGRELPKKYVDALAKISADAIRDELGVQS